MNERLTLLKAARMLRSEAREYIAAAKSGKQEDRRYFGRKAAKLMGVANSLKIIVVNRESEA